ncbi:12096_t:CDS:1, partial [Acaulospora morrowiae]
MSYQDEEHESHGANTPSNPRGLNGISNGQTQNQVNGRTNPLNSQQGSGNQDEQITTLKLAGLSVLMYKKKGEIIYRLADNMSVNSLSDEQREMLLKEIKALHDSSTTVITQPSSS